jgi:hypothetical protein
MREREEKEREEILKEDGREIGWMKEIWKRREMIEKENVNFLELHIPGDQEGLFKLAVQLRKIFNSVIYKTATGYVLLVYLTNM